MKTLFFIMSLFGTTILFSQSITKQVVASSGESLTNGSTQLTLTIGEAVIGNIDNTTTVQQGFLANIQANTLSVEDQLVDATIKLYPNPVTEYLTIDIDKLTELSIVIYNITGKEIYKSKLNQQRNTINVSALSSGTYLIQINTTNSLQSKSFKIIKQ